MPKGKMNITMDQDLIEYAKIYANEQRTTVSEVFSQFVLNMKRLKENDPMVIVLGDPCFRDSLLETMTRIQSGDVQWSRYDEVF
jgi:precorrin-6B methylase 1